MKIAQVCSIYSANSGVGEVVRQISKELVKRGHKVDVLSSDLHPPTKEKGVKVHQFKVKRKKGDYWVSFPDFLEQLKKGGYDLVHVHGYRRPHSNQAADFCKKHSIPCILTTHAPFKRKRKLLAGIFIGFYDVFFGRKELEKYNRVLAISEWELPLLKKICSKEKIIFSPNGISNEFANIKPTRKKNKVCFIGNITPLKNIGLLVAAAKRLPKIQFEILGPVAEGCALPDLPENVKLVNKIYDKREQINLLKESKIYVLPSKREGIPQTLLEAMACGVVVVSSDHDAGKELLSDGRGLLFKNGVAEDLCRILRFILEHYSQLKDVRSKAKKYAQKRLWKKLVIDLETAYKQHV